MRRLPFIALGIIALVVGCGLSVETTGAPTDADGGGGGGGGPIATPSSDASAAIEDAAAPPADAWPSPPASCTSCADIAPPAGWVPIAFAASTAAACPGDLTGVDLVMNPAPRAGACTCGACAMAGLPSCTGGQWSSFYDQSSGVGTCNENSPINHPGSNGACEQYDNFLARHTRIQGPTPAGGAGTCSAPGVAAANPTNSTAVRACLATSTSTTCPCDVAAIGAGYKTCLRSPGDQACPSGVPQKHLVGAGAAVTCGACPCNLSAPTCSGTVTFYSDAACGTAVATVNTTVCSATNQVDYRSYRWAGTTNATCNLGASPATTSLTDVATVCCKPQ